MVDVFSNKIRIEEDDDIEKMESLWYNLRMFASVCLKVSDEEINLSSSSGSIINIPMSEKKPLPFNLNVKPRTCRRPRSKPIDAQALFPCLYKKRKIIDSHQIPKKRRLIVRFKLPPSKPEPISSKLMDSR